MIFEQKLKIKCKLLFFYFLKIFRSLSALILFEFYQGSCQNDISSSDARILKYEQFLEREKVYSKS